MNNSKYIALLLLLSCFFPSIHAHEKEENDVLTIDQAILPMTDLEFINKSDIEPNKSDFTIRNYLLMSNKSGERWATITLENMSSGQRLLNKKQIVAVFANGDRRYPLLIEHKFTGGEVATFTVNFGETKFPLLYVFTKN